MQFARRNDRDVASSWKSEALLAQWLERAAVNRKVTGSIPVGSVFFFVAMGVLWATHFSAAVARKEKWWKRPVSRTTRF